MSLIATDPPYRIVAKKRTDRGWHWPANAQRAHYFVKGESLCEEYVLDADRDEVWGGAPPLIDSDVILADDDCPVCGKRLFRAKQVRKVIRDASK
ncbi:MAG: hypothetical protein VW405_00195 [Rhodospirillaceae bacterium]